MLKAPSRTSGLAMPPPASRVCIAAGVRVSARGRVAAGSGARARGAPACPSPVGTAVGRIGLCAAGCSCRRLGVCGRAAATTRTAPVVGRIGWISVGDAAAASPTAVSIGVWTRVRVSCYKRPPAQGCQIRGVMAGMPRNGCCSPASRPNSRRARTKAGGRSCWGFVERRNTPYRVLLHRISWRFLSLMPIFWVWRTNNTSRPRVQTRISRSPPFSQCSRAKTRGTAPDRAGATRNHWNPLRPNDRKSAITLGNCMENGWLSRPIRV